MNFESDLIYNLSIKTFLVEKKSQNCILEDEVAALDLMNQKGRNQRQREQLGGWMIPPSELSRKDSPSVGSKKKDESDNIKIENFCTWKDTVNRV